MEIWRKLCHPLICEGYMISSRGNVKISNELTKGENIYISSIVQCIEWI